MTATRTARWHFDAQDTDEQRRTLRSNRSAQTTRSRFAAGTRVRARNTRNIELGTVERHVPGRNAQGGYLLIHWDSTNHIGRVSPITVESIEES